MRVSMRKSLLILTAFGLICSFKSASASCVGWYGSELCRDRQNFNCVTVGEKVLEKKTGDKTTRRVVDMTWEDLWPDPAEREIVMKLNRLNLKLRAGYQLAVPKSLSGKSIMSFTPFERKIKPPGEKLLIFDPRLYAFAAYDADGGLVRWGPAVGGRAGLRTPAGTFRVYSEGDASCRSRIYPRGCRGRQCSPMPYCMTFHQGNAFHAGDLPGRHASHGCVRLFLDDARWLNHDFVENGARVEIRPY